MPIRKAIGKIGAKIAVNHIVNKIYVYLVDNYNLEVYHSEFN